jgi:hypothetical protein
MNLHTRLDSVQRERSRRCVACGGPIVAAPPRQPTWRTVLEDLRALPDEETVAMYAALNQMHRLPPALQEQAHRLYCQQQGIPYENQGSVYSAPNPPPAPWFPETGPAPRLPPRWRD